MIYQINRISLCCLLLCAAVLPAHGKPSGRKVWSVIEKTLSGFETEARERQPDNRALAAQLVLAGDLLDEFVINYPKDKRWWRARIMLPGIKTGAARLLKSRIRWNASLREINEILADARLPSKNRPDAEHIRISLLRSKLAYEGLSEQETAELVQYMRAYADAYPKHKFAHEIHYELGLRLITADPDRAARAFRAATKSSDARLANKAERELAVLPYRSAPLDLEFVALDGRKVAMSDLKGKVVLIDFWATWCKPCIAEIPRIKGVYDRYRDKGFEIVGISFDSKRSDLKDYIAGQRMDWPQYFDGRGWDSKIGERFSIRSIPTMWLLDKQGRIISTKVRGSNLERYLREALRAE